MVFAAESARLSGSGVDAAPGALPSTGAPLFVRAPGYGASAGLELAETHALLVAGVGGELDADVAVFGCGGNENREPIFVVG